MQSFVHPPNTELDVEYLVNHAMPGRTSIGAPSGKPAFGYAMSLLCAQNGAHDSLEQQLKIIDVIGRCYGYTVEMNMIFLDLASEQCSTHRFGLKQLLIACKSPLLDADAVLLQSPDRLSRMPDELEAIRKLLFKTGKNLVCSTSMPAISVAEVEHSMGTQYRSGHTR